MATGFIRKLALTLLAACAALPSSAAFAQVTQVDLGVQLRQLILNVNRPQEATVEDINSTFSAVLQKREQLEQQQQQQQQQRREEIQLANQSLLQKIQQQMQALQQANQLAMNQKAQQAADRYLSQLSEEQRALLEQRSEEAKQRAQQKIVEQNNPPPASEPEPQPEPDDWRDAYPFYRDDILTGRFDGWESWIASFEGTLVGVAGDASALTGQVLLDIYSDGELLGELNFGNSDALLFGGMMENSGRIIGQTYGGNSSVFGGVVASDLEVVHGDLYGPNGENVGGEWSFEVTGGPRHGTARGQFGAGRVEPQ